MFGSDSKIRNHEIARNEILVHHYIKFSQTKTNILKELGGICLVKASETTILLSLVAKVDGTAEQTPGFASTS